MLAGLLDTAVVVDLLRSYKPAEAWLATVHAQLGLSPVVWLEIIDGAQLPSATAGPAPSARLRPR